MPAVRFVIEGEWTGYTRAQRQVVHRTVHPAREKTLRAWAEKTHAIRYSDGTLLVLRVRDAKLREHVNEINGYGSLIRDCARHNVSSVDALPSD
jgi:hypothetical protein